MINQQIVSQARMDVHHHLSIDRSCAREKGHKLSSWPSILLAYPALRLACHGCYLLFLLPHLHRHGFAPARCTGPGSRKARVARPGSLTFRRRTARSDGRRSGHLIREACTTGSIPAIQTRVRLHQLLLRGECLSARAAAAAATSKSAGAALCGVRVESSAEGVSSAVAPSRIV